VQKRIKSKNFGSSGDPGLSPDGFSFVDFFSKEKKGGPVWGRILVTLKFFLKIFFDFI
jgi:hypothetical protein